MKTARQLRTELARLRWRLRRLAGTLREAGDDVHLEIDNILSGAGPAPADESWQPLTADTVLPESGYLVLCDKGGNLRLASGHYGMWAVHGEGDYEDEEDICECYTHYRVLRGPEGV